MSAPAWPLYAEITSSRRAYCSEVPSKGRVEIVFAICCISSLQKLFWNKHMYYSIYPRKKKALLQKKSGVFDFFYEIYVKCAGVYRYSYV